MRSGYGNTKRKDGNTLGIERAWAWLLFQQEKERRRRLKVSCRRAQRFLSIEFHLRKMEFRSLGGHCHTAEEGLQLLQGTDCLYVMHTVEGSVHLETGVLPWSASSLSASRGIARRGRRKAQKKLDPTPDARGESLLSPHFFLPHHPSISEQSKRYPLDASCRASGIT